MPLNDKLLKNVKSSTKRYEIADSDGLSVRFSPDSSLTFQYRFRIIGKQFRVDFGAYLDNFTYRSARASPFSKKNETAFGNNPLEEKGTHTFG
ncbi:Arm DNA-binding domain-containing protein [Nitrosomonas sp.]|uniref:Arm DNA-binding domain-containing protein n=1 Tax=Nitrosomonas sp. TaxID=42353 RepID=UPI0035AFC354